MQEDPYKDIITLSKQMTIRELAKHYGHKPTTTWKILSRRRIEARGGIPPAPIKIKYVKPRLLNLPHPDVSCEIVPTKEIDRCHGFDNCPHYIQCLDYAASKHFRGWIGIPKKAK